jgi:hypothetical protein
MPSDRSRRRIASIQAMVKKGNGLARDTDFLDLYNQLDLQPGCDLAELKQAYRRRLAILHPDRQVGPESAAHAPAELQRLTALYGAAIEFHRQHDRLPGGGVVRPMPHVGANRASAAATAQVVEPAGHRRWWLVVLIGIAVAVFVWWQSDPSPDAVTAAPESAESTDVATPATVHPAGLIDVGMSTDAVQAIEGDPLVMTADRWEYGPSWIRFEDHKVVDWYSSALRPLKAAPRRAHP